MFKSLFSAALSLLGLVIVYFFVRFGVYFFIGFENGTAPIEPYLVVIAWGLAVVISYYLYRHLCHREGAALRWLIAILVAALFIYFDAIPYWEERQRNVEISRVDAQREAAVKTFREAYSNDAPAVEKLDKLRAIELPENTAPQVVRQFQENTAAAYLELNILGVNSYEDFRAAVNAIPERACGALKIASGGKTSPTKDELRQWYRVIEDYQLFELGRGRYCFPLDVEPATQYPALIERGLIEEAALSVQFHRSSRWDIRPYLELALTKGQADQRLITAIFTHMDLFNSYSPYDGRIDFLLDVFPLLPAGDQYLDIIIDRIIVLQQEPRRRYTFLPAQSDLDNFERMEQRLGADHKLFMAMPQDLLGQYRAAITARNALTKGPLLRFYVYNYLDRFINLDSPAVHQKHEILVNGNVVGVARSDDKGCVQFQLRGVQEGDLVSAKGVSLHQIHFDSLTVHLLPANTREGALQRLAYLGFSEPYTDQEVTDLERQNAMEHSLDLPLSAAFDYSAWQVVAQAYEQIVANVECFPRP